jgi:hypothetical protein
LKRRGVEVKLLNLDQSALMEVNSLRRDGNYLIIKGTILGSMPVTCALTPAEARSVFKLLDLRTMLFLVTLFFRR